MPLGSKELKKFRRRGERYTCNEIGINQGGEQLQTS